MSPPIIDFHTHFLVRDVMEQCLPHAVATNRGHHQLPPHLQALFEKMMTAEGIMEGMDKLRVDAAVISSPAVLLPLHWAEPSVALKLAQRLNDTAAAWAHASPKRIIGSFVLPLQAMDLALLELRRATDELGLKVVNIPAEVRGAYLGDPQFEAFWQAATDLNLVVFMHPDGAKDPWFFQYGMWNSLGQSLEEAKFMASVIYQGVLERYPKLKLVIAHGGGYFPHNMGRLDRNVKNAPHSIDPTVLSALVKIVGPERLVLGSDWPIGEADPIGFVDGCTAIGEADKAMINGGRVAELVGLAA